ncbi:MAG: acyl carrier protein [Oscillospiraceae bacterium]|nr:acyl carrier protein [Oscillospiraceae bacterium]
MNRTEISEKVNGIFRDIFDDDTLVITDETTAADIEDWDSLEQINILVAMEKTFGIKFSVGEVEGLKNVGEMMDLIASKLA